ncbi:rhodanese-like domain-containing protein [Pseudomonadota bacterium]
MSNAPLPLEIDCHGLRTVQVKNAKYAVIDVRMPHEVVHAPAGDSVNIPLNHLPQHLDRLPNDVEHLVIVCAHGQRSMVATQWLRQNGFHNAQSLAGGMASWRRFEAMAA